MAEDVKIPIKGIIQRFERNYNCVYDDDERNIMRRFFIACLNLGYLIPAQLDSAVEKLTQKIRRIDSVSLKRRSGLEYYTIKGDTLFVCADLKDVDTTLYEKTVFKALSEAVIGFDEFPNISDALFEMMAEKIYNMDVNGSRIILPKTKTYIIGDEVLELRAGYERLNFTINLLKQLFIAKSFNENIFLRNLINGGGKEEKEKILSDKTVKLLLEILEVIAELDKLRIINGIYNPKELEYLVTYQRLVSSLFKEADKSFLAFCALVTSDSLRDEFMDRFRE